MSDGYKDSHSQENGAQNVKYGLIMIRLSKPVPKHGYLFLRQASSADLATPAEPLNPGFTIHNFIAGIGDGDRIAPTEWTPHGVTPHYVSLLPVEFCDFST